MLRATAFKAAQRSLQALRLSSSQLRYAETQAVSGEALDWDRLQDFVASDDGKRELAALRTSFISLQGREPSQKSASINWDSFKDSVEPETLAIFKKAYSDLKLPNYDPSKDIEEAKALFKPLYDQANELAAFSEKRLKEIDQELKAIDNEKEKMSQLLVDDELASHPNIAKQIDKEIGEGNFTP